MDDTTRTTRRQAGASPSSGAVHPQLPPGPSARTRSRVGRRKLVSGTIRQLRFVNDRPVALREHITYATSGEWTTEHDGWRRSLALFYAHLVAVPVSTLCYLLAWLSARPGRFATALVVATTVWLALRTLPTLLISVEGWRP
jgi:hypothetical protein